MKNEGAGRTDSSKVESLRALLAERTTERDEAVAALQSHQCVIPIADDEWGPDLSSSKEPTDD